MWLVRHPESAAGRLLNSPIHTQVGVMFYSIYIWQMLFLDQHASWFKNQLWPAFIAIAGCSAASDYLVEQPALRLRSRIRFRERTLAPARSLVRCSRGLSGPVARRDRVATDLDAGQIR